MVTPPVTVLLRGNAIRLLPDGSALAVDPGTVMVVGVTAVIRNEQTLTIGTPASMAVTFSGPHSVSAGDNVQTRAFDLRGDLLPPFGVVQADGHVVPFR